EMTDLPALVRQIAAAGCETQIHLDDVTYFLSKIEIVQTDAPGMAPWRKRLFLATAHIADDAVDYFKLPRHRTVLLGSAIEIVRGCLSTSGVGTRNRRLVEVVHVRNGVVTPWRSRFASATLS